MLAVERRKHIMEKLQQEGKVYVPELSRTFEVTEETVRRDLEKLEKEGLLRRSYGGAILEERTNEDLSFVKRSSINSNLKEIIGKQAAALIQDGDTIMMDSSTTCLALLRSLSGRSGLTIITNSIRLAYDFTNSPFHIISTGGSLRANSFALTGPITHSSLEKYHVDFAAFSCKGIDMKRGIMESNEEESIVKQTMIEQAKKSILLVDHTKFDRIAFTTTCNFSHISTIVTDRPPGREWMDFLEDKQVELITGEPV